MSTDKINKTRKSLNVEKDEAVDDDHINKKLKTTEPIIDKLIIKSPIGPLIITANQELLYSVKLYNFDKKLDENTINEQVKSTSNSINKNKILNQFNEELDQYFKGELKEFKTPINIKLGTEFQQKVWSQLMKIPYGITSSYKQISILLGLGSKSARAIATSCRLNIFLLIVPCHRVISSSGKVIGYNGKQGIDKQFILSSIEKADIK